MNVKIIILITAGIFLQLFPTKAAEKRDILVNTYSKEILVPAVTEGQSWVNLPSFQNREFWNGLPETIKDSFIKKGEEALSFDWPIVKATDYLEYIRSGDRDIMQQPNSNRVNALKNLVMAELVEGKGRFLDQIVNGVWAICEQSSWVLSAHISLQKQYNGLPDIKNIVIDLGSGETGALLSWVHYFFKDDFDKINPLIAMRIKHEVKQNILEPYYARTDLWWMGLGDAASTNNRRGLVNNWNPWINYNVLQCILLIEDDQEKRVDNIYKTMVSVDQFINSYNDDGACDEGPSYWGHAGGKLFEYLELLNAATSGKVNIFNHQLIKNIGTYIYDVYINDPYFVNFADASAKGSVNAGLVYRYGEAIDDSAMKKFGAFYAHQKQLDKVPSTGSIESIITDLITYPALMATEPIEPLVNDFWYPQTEIAGAREYPASKKGFYFAAKGGHNDEFHNHNDVGSFILYYDGEPFLVDVGVGTYTRQTFSADRYKIFTMQSGYHNLPKINGVEQSAGLDFYAKETKFSKDGRKYTFSTDISSAYPENAAVSSWKRTYRLIPKKEFQIVDNFQLKNFVAANELVFITPYAVELVKPGLLKLSSKGVELYMDFDSNNFDAPEIEGISIEDNRLKRSWDDGLNRITLKASGTKLRGEYTIKVRR